MKRGRRGDGGNGEGHEIWGDGGHGGGDSDSGDGDDYGACKGDDKVEQQK